MGTFEEDIDIKKRELRKALDQHRGRSSFVLLREVCPGCIHEHIDTEKNTNCCGYYKPDSVYFDTAKKRFWCHFREEP